MENPTRFKLQEAGFFLSKMKEHYNDSLIFRYYFSAFLSAARSILDYMKKQYSKSIGFKQWCKMNDPLSDTDISLLNKLRVENIHIQTLNTIGTYQQEVTFSPSIDEIKILREKNVLIPRQEMSVSQAKLIMRYISEKKDVDIVDLCEQLLGTIRNIVNECETKFQK